jgi:hypothetical protein
MINIEKKIYYRVDDMVWNQIKDIRFAKKLFNQVCIQSWEHVREEVWAPVNRFGRQVPNQVWGQLKDEFK